MGKSEIQSAFLEKAKVVALKNSNSPAPEPNEVVIRPIFTAICGSDVSFFEGHRTPPEYPMILGHEVVGEITEVGGNVSNLIRGQRVIVEPNYPCGECKFCQAGRGNICPNKKSLGVSIPGCFAELFRAPTEFCWAVPDSIADEDAVVIEPLTVSLHALWQSGVVLGDTIAVIGCGSTGLLLVQAAKMQGARVIAHDLIQSKLDLARELGAEVYEAHNLADLWQEQGVTTIFECAGSSATVEIALDAAPRGSEVILMGLSSSKSCFQPLRFVREGLRLSGSLIYSHPHDFQSAINLVEKHTLSPRSIISDIIPFTRIQEAMQLAGKGESSKVLLDMRG